MNVRDKLGVCQWFHYQAFEELERAIIELRALNVRRLRTGVSWADYHRPGGRAWYDWQFSKLAEFDVLVSVWHTPPSIAEGAECAGPPRRLPDYAEFIGEVIERYGHQFSELELWNEPNNRYKWAFDRFDPDWCKFGTMVRQAAAVAHQAGKRTVLGGMIPVDHHWLRLMEGYGALEHIDVVAIHGFPQMWWDNAPSWDWESHWQGWDQKLRYIREAAGGRPIWITETGLATWDLQSGAPARFELQQTQLQAAAQADAERAYWYSLIDLNPSREAIEGFHVDENEYHMGLVDWEGHRKPAFETARQLLRRPQTFRKMVRPATAVAPRG